MRNILNPYGTVTSFILTNKNQDKSKSFVVMTTNLTQTPRILGGRSQARQHGDRKSHEEDTHSMARTRSFMLTNERLMHFAVLMDLCRKSSDSGTRAEEDLVL